MKKVIGIILLILGLALLDAQVDTRRLVLEQGKTEKPDNQLPTNAPGHFLDVGDDDANELNEHGKSRSYRNPVTNSMPEVADGMNTENGKAEKPHSQLPSDMRGRVLDVDDDASNENNEHGNSSTNGNPVTGSMPEVANGTNTENGKTNGNPANENSNSAKTDDESNSSYKNYGNTSGSSTETHHTYINDCQPRKPC